MVICLIAAECLFLGPWSTSIPFGFATHGTRGWRFTTVSDYLDWALGKPASLQFWCSHRSWLHWIYAGVCTRLTMGTRIALYTSVLSQWFRAQTLNPNPSCMDLVYTGSKQPMFLPPMTLISGSMGLKQFSIGLVHQRCMHGTGVDLPNHCKSFKPSLSIDISFHRSLP